MKKLKSLFIFLLCITAVFSAAGCGMLISGGNVHNANGFTQEKLMSARESVRQSNIAIDTLYQKKGFFISRTQGVGLGSGVIFKEDQTNYYALTNHHVITNVLDGVEYTTKYTITDINGYEYDGTVLISDPDMDIAIVGFQKRADSVLHLIDYRSRIENNVVQEEFVLAVGNPSGVKNIVTFGRILGYSRIGNVDYTVIHHNALINPGNSGGALCDLDGNLLGLNTWGSENKDDNNFAIPLSQINDFIDKFESSFNTSSEQQAA